MITEVENTMTLTGNQALVTEQATQNESDPGGYASTRIGENNDYRS